LAELQVMFNELRFTSLRHLLLSTNVALHLYVGDVEWASQSLSSMWDECRDKGLHRFPLLRAMVLGMEGDCAWADRRAPVRRRRQRIFDICAKLASEPIAWAPAAASSLRARAFELDGDFRQERVQLQEAARGYRACGMMLSAALAERRFSIAAREEGGDAESRACAETEPLAGFAIARPDRWSRIMHSIY
jgi:hypothetical protein